MTPLGLAELFRALPAPQPQEDDRPFYSAANVAGFRSYFVGKDGLSHPCLMVATAERPASRPAPIRLESLDAQFDVRCRLRQADGQDREGSFAVVRCRSLDETTVHYFLSVCEAFPRLVGDHPTTDQLAGAVDRLALIFQRLSEPSTRTINGLFGELFFISLSNEPTSLLEAWRIDPSSRFDFVLRDVRLDVKTTQGRIRSHTFTHEQCNAPAGTLALIASMFVERVAVGITMQELIRNIEDRLLDQPQLVLKLHEVAAASLGEDLTRGLGVAFDARLSESTLEFFDLNEIPALRGPVPRGVSHVSFQSDLSGIPSVSVESLVNAHPGLRDAVLMRRSPARS